MKEIKKPQSSRKQLNEYLDQDISKQKKFYTHYVLGNLYNNLSNLMTEDPSGCGGIGAKVFLLISHTYMCQRKRELHLL